MQRTLVGGVVCLLFAAACTRPESATGPSPKAATAVPATPPAPVPTVRYVGRFDTSDPNAPRFAWEGSTIIARFKGTAISAKLKDDGKNVFLVIVDNEPKAVFKSEPGNEQYVLAEGLPDAVHEVALYKRTEAEMGEVAFLGFEVKGEMLAAQPAPDRRIELIGDSITAGYGNEGPGAVCPYNPMEQNQYTTYGAIAARALGAEHVTIAWSGKTIKEMTSFYERTLPSRPDSRWDFKAWIPHVVVMNIGTNNFANADPGEGNFVKLYTTLFDRVRKAYPEAFILCLLGPMLSDAYPPGRNNLSTARKYMRSSIAKIRASGEKNFDFVELPEQKHSDGLGCGFHPSVKTHKLMADRLVPILKEKLAW